MSIIRNNLKSVLDRIQIAIYQRPADVRSLDKLAWLYKYAYFIQHI